MRSRFFTRVLRTFPTFFHTVQVEVLLTQYSYDTTNGLLDHESARFIGRFTEFFPGPVLENAPGRTSVGVRVGVNVIVRGIDCVVVRVRVAVCVGEATCVGVPDCVHVDVAICVAVCVEVAVSIFALRKTTE